MMNKVIRLCVKITNKKQLLTTCEYCGTRLKLQLLKGNYKSVSAGSPVVRQITVVE
jgi:hypothetical protein